VAAGAFDAHLGAVGAGAKPQILVKVMGTSTCDMLLAPPEAIGKRTVRGICGQVDGSILPGYIGLEAGQSAFGDIYAWYQRLLAWPLTALPTRQQAHLLDRLLPDLERAALALPPLGTGELAVDWFNGRRTPDADPSLRGSISGLHLGSDAPTIYRALVEASHVAFVEGDAFIIKECLNVIKISGIR
jgi:L-ribulokinase